MLSLCAIASLKLNVPLSKHLGLPVPQPSNAPPQETVVRSVITPSVKPIIPETVLNVDPGEYLLPNALLLNGNLGSSANSA